MIFKTSNSEYLLRIHGKQLITWKRKQALELFQIQAKLADLGMERHLLFNELLNM
jgi:hypothetical protein